MYGLSGSYEARGLANPGFFNLMLPQLSNWARGFSADEHKL